MLTGNISFAQNSILAGKIVNENNEPMAGAEIKLSRVHEEALELKADEDGLYCSNLVEQGAYKLAVYKEGKYLNAGKIVLNEKSGSQLFYIVKVSDRKVTIDEINEDPSIKVKLAKIRDGRHNEMMGDQFFLIKIDSATGKLKSMQGPAGGVPKAY